MGSINGLKVEPRNQLLCLTSSEMSTQIIMTWGNTSHGGLQTLNPIVDEEAKEE